MRSAIKRELWNIVAGKWIDRYAIGQVDNSIGRKIDMYIGK